MTNQYWADAATQNCVWMFQVKQLKYGGEGCTCGHWNYEEACENDDVEECTCGIITWHTEAIYLTREEAKAHGEARPYAWGKQNEGWRIYGVPAKGIMVDLLGQHNKEFEDKVEYITEYKEEKDIEEFDGDNPYWSGIDRE